MMEFLRETFFENPLPLILALGVVWVAFVVAWWHHRRRALTVALVVLPVVAGGGMLTAHLVETPREMIVRHTKEIAQHFEQGQWDRLSEFLDEDFESPLGQKDETIAAASQARRTFDVMSVDIISNNVDMMNEVAASRLQAKVNYNADAGTHMSEWMVYWALRETGWKIISVKHQQMNLPGLPGRRYR